MVYRDCYVVHAPLIVCRIYTCGTSRASTLIYFSQCLALTRCPRRECDGRLTINADPTKKGNVITYDPIKITITNNAKSLWRLFITTNLIVINTKYWHLCYNSISLCHYILLSMNCLNLWFTSAWMREQVIKNTSKPFLNK